LKSKGFALAAVLLIVVIVPIAVFGVTFFITSSITRHETQARSMKALYLAEAGIHRAIFNIRSTGTPLPVSNWNASDQIAVTVVAQCSNIYQLESVGTSVASTYPTQISRTIFAQYDSGANNVSLYREGDGTGIPAPVCCDDIWWPFSEGSGYSTGTAPYVGTLTPSNVTGPAWASDRFGTAAKALNFNAGGTHNYVTVPDNSGLDLTTEGTLTAWIYMTAFPANGTGIVRRGSSSSDSAQEAYGLLIVASGSNRRAQIMLRESSGGTRRTVTAGGGANLAINTWYFVAGSWGPLGMRVFVNGVTRGSNSSVRSSYNTTSPLSIGTLRSGSSGTRFFGRIDEVHLYACQKTDQEILDLYNASKP